MLSNISYKESISKQLADGLFSTTEHFCLVPAALYQEENSDLWLNFGKEKIANTQEVAIAYIASQDCYLLWEREADTAATTKHIIEEILNIETMVISGHEESGIRSLLQPNGVICVLQGKQMIVVLLLQGKLQIATMYRVDTQEDILYHLLNIYTQWQLDANTFPTCLIGANTSVETFINQYVAVE